MKLAVIGAGAIGGWLTAGFIEAGATATVLARGKTLQALQSEGLGLDDGTTQKRYQVRATNDPAALHDADILLLGVKAHDLPGLAPSIKVALGPKTVVLPAINGLPWWFFDTFGGPARGLRLKANDPGGVLARLMPSDRVVGSVVHAASYVEAPGQIRLVKGNHVWLGEAGKGENAGWIAQMLSAGSVPAAATQEIHREVWNKLWGNSNMNPLTALARADTQQLLEDDGARGLVIAMMQEMSALGDRIGLTGFDNPAERIEVTRKLGAIRTSMLQDVDAGRAIELAPILGALVELGGHLGLPTPVMGGVHGLARLLDVNLRHLSD